MTDPTELDRQVIALAERLERAGKWVSLDHRVREPVAAEVLGVTGRTLQRWREAGTGPAFVVLSRNVTYRVVDLLQWVESRRHAA